MEPELCTFFPAFSWFWDLNPLTGLDLNEDWKLHSCLPRSVGWLVLLLGMLDVGCWMLLLVGGAAEVLPASLSCLPLPLQSTHPLPFVVFLCLRKWGAINTRNSRYNQSLHSFVLQFL